MLRERIDRYLNEALENFSYWVKSNQWIGKEHDCVNLFAHKFLFEKIQPGAAIQCPTQICIECGLKQPKKYEKMAARKDLIVWGHPLQNTWSGDWKPVNVPKVVMEWKVFRTRFSKSIFDKHDEEWIGSYTKEHRGVFGYLVSVDFSSDQRRVYWKQSKQGVYSKTHVV